MSASLGFPLVSNGLNGLLDRLLITKELHRDDRLKNKLVLISRVLRGAMAPYLQILVKFVDERNASWKIASHDLFI